MNRANSSGAEESKIDHVEKEERRLGKPTFSIEGTLDPEYDSIGHFKEHVMNQDHMRARTKAFAHNCVKTAMKLSGGPLQNHIRGQLVRCSTSVAANCRAACLAQSRAGFAAKINIVLEEADESAFWLEFTTDELLLENEIVEPLLQEAKELASIFFATRKIVKSKQNAS